VLKRLFFGLGVLLGVLSPRAEPELSARVFQYEGVLYVSAELPGAFEGASAELLENGATVALELEASLQPAQAAPEATRKTRPAIARRTLRYEAASATWLVGLSPEGEEKRLASLKAAVILASRVWALPLGPVGLLEGGGSVHLVSRPGILDEGGAWHAAAILWGYAEPAKDLGFASMAEVPF
jgi:hypothetical protein